jgi:hypothetical protein
MMGMSDSPLVSPTASDKFGMDTPGKMEASKDKLRQNLNQISGAAGGEDNLEEGPASTAAADNGKKA